MSFWVFILDSHLAIHQTWRPFKTKHWFRDIYLIIDLACATWVQGWVCNKYYRVHDQRNSIYFVLLLTTWEQKSKPMVQIKVPVQSMKKCITMELISQHVPTMFYLLIPTPILVLILVQEIVLRAWDQCCVQIKGRLRGVLNHNTTLSSSVVFVHVGPDNITMRCHIQCTFNSYVIM